MAFVDFTPLAFKELELLPRVVFTLGTCLLLAAFFILHNLALGLFGAGLIFLGVAYNYFLNSFPCEPGPPHKRFVSFGTIAQCALSAITAAGLLYIAFHTYRHGALPTWLQPLPHLDTKR
jgi:hypothetical protein